MLVDNVIQGFQEFYGNGENTPWVFLMVLLVAFFSHSTFHRVCAPVPLK